MTTKTTDNLLTPEDVARQLAISRKTLAAMRHRGDGPPSCKLGDGATSPVRYRRADVERFIDSRFRPDGRR